MSNIDNFFGKMYHACNVLEHSTNKWITLDELRVSARNIREIMFDLQKGYSGVYYKIEVKIPESVATKDILKFLENLYETLKEAKGLFVDQWIYGKLNEVSEIITKLLYNIKYIR